MNPFCHRCDRLNVGFWHGPYCPDCQEEIDDERETANDMRADAYWDDVRSKDGEFDDAQL